MAQAYLVNTNPRIKWWWVFDEFIFSNIYWLPCWLLPTTLAGSLVCKQDNQFMNGFIDRVSANKFFRYNFPTFNSIYLMDPTMTAPSRSKSSLQTKLFNTSLPAGSATVNWVTAGFSTPVKDQGVCGENRKILLISCCAILCWNLPCLLYQSGSCWAYAATEVIESMYLIKIGGASQTSTLRLSTQQLVSCCTAENGCYSYGCNGGWSDEVSNFLFLI